MTEKTKLIIDTDIGDDIDDAYAIALCLASPEIDVLGVTTVYRNCEQRSRLARALLAACGRPDIPVYAGEDLPLREPMRFFDYEEKLPDGRPVIAHYDEGMAGYRYEAEPAVSYLTRSLDGVSLLAIGPLTNVARAAAADPAAFARCRELIVMGGDPAGRIAEWNFRCDPEAAAIVLATGVPVRLVGINVTGRCAVSPQALDGLLALTGSANALLNRMMRVLLRDRPGRPPIMHDGLAAAVPARDFCVWERKRLRVETDGPRRGFTLPDETAPPVEAAVGVDSEGFLRFLSDRLAALKTADGANDPTGEAAAARAAAEASE